MFLAAEHFVRAPEWTWYILGYFFLAGLTGGSYAIATLLRMVGDPRDEPAARIGFYTSFFTVLICPLLLTVDLGQPFRFWHMMINVTPLNAGLNFKYWSPMSVGVWALLIFGFFATVSALESLVLDRPARVAILAEAGRRVLGGVAGRVFNIIGALLALFIASYTGVLLSVSNQPIWSDTWTLGALFLASGLSGSAALIGFLLRYRPPAMFSLRRLDEAGSYFAILEVVMLAAFLITVAAAGTATRLLPWTPLFVIALIGIGTSLLTLRGRVEISAADGSTALERRRITTLVASAVILIGVLSVRAAVIFGAQ